MSDKPGAAAPGAENIESIPQQSPSSVQGRNSSDRHQQTEPSHHAFAAQFDATGHTGPNRPSPYDMAVMGSALPQVGYRQAQYPHAGQQQYGMNSAMTQPLMHQMPQQSPYGGQQAMPMSTHGYYVQQPHVAQYYGAQMTTAQGHANVSSRQGMPYYQNQLMMSPPQSGYYYPQPNQYTGPAQPMSPNTIHNQYMTTTTSSQEARGLNQSPVGASFPSPVLKQGSGDGERRQSTVRGPPRKPRQSGHAIWIGNLPPQTDLMSLVQHVCKEASGLESLFLISKSNCAFANFKDEPTCAAAQQHLHDSKFQSVRLVSRLRKSTVEGNSGVTAPTGPASSATSVPGSDDPIAGSAVSESENSNLSFSEITPTRPSHGGGPTQQDRFFVLKSLTMEDLEHSVTTGIWATQSHNEESLNTAFKSADNVYLVFSANKSGEYFGYAKMTSEINEDPDAAIEFAPSTHAAPSEVDLPKAIPTTETEYAPKGRIIDDSARGTIFWEVDRGEYDSGSEDESETQSNKSETAEDGPRTWGKPFKLEWLSTTRLPFYRTRGLRNPWNSNREVKIARDGTELEPSVGRRLIGLFNRIQSPGPVPAVARGPQPMGPGFPPMRPYG